MEDAEKPGVAMKCCVAYAVVIAAHRLVAAGKFAAALVEIGA